MDGTILSQGTFAVPATIVPLKIPVPSGVDWVSVVNLTQSASGGQAGSPLFGASYYWQSGMVNGSSIVTYNSNANSIVNRDYIAAGGIYLYDPSGQTPGAQPLLSAPVATTAMTNATRPVVSTASTSGLSVGTVVRMSLTAQSEVDSVDMVVGAVTLNTSFTLLTATNAMANSAGVVGGVGFYRIVYNPPLFYPRRLVITNITQATSAQVSTSVAHGLTPGQQLRFTIQATSSMVQLNGLTGFIMTVVDDYNFTVSINTTTFSAFTFPTTAQFPASYPIVVPFGENTAASLSIIAAQTPSIGGVQIYGTQSGILADSTVNTGFLGMILGIGGLGAINAGSFITGPAGSALNDIVLWRAGKSSYVSNLFSL